MTWIVGHTKWIMLVSGLLTSCLCAGRSTASGRVLAG